MLYFNKGQGVREQRETGSRQRNNADAVRRPLLIGLDYYRDKCRFAAPELTVGQRAFEIRPRLDCRVIREKQAADRRGGQEHRIMSKLQNSTSSKFFSAIVNALQAACHARCATYQTTFGGLLAE